MFNLTLQYFDNIYVHIYVIYHVAHIRILDTHIQAYSIHIYMFKHIVVVVYVLPLL